MIKCKRIEPGGHLLMNGTILNQADSESPAPAADLHDTSTSITVIMPAVISIAVHTRLHPLDVLENVLACAGASFEARKKAQQSAHEYLFACRHQLPWRIMPPL